jgi:hypothetical protein
MRATPSKLRRGGKSNCSPTSFNMPLVASAARPDTRVMRGQFAHEVSYPLAGMSPHDEAMRPGVEVEVGRR